MSFKQKFFSAVTVALALVAFSTFVSAQDKSDTPNPPAREGKMEKRFGEGHHGRGGMHGRHFGDDRMMFRFLRGIELTEAQQTQIKTLMEAHRASLAPQQEELRTLFQKKRDGSLTEADKTRLTEIHNQRKASSEQLKATIMGMLTPDQVAKLEQMKAERQQRMEERKQRMMERRQQRENRTEKPATDN
ncbi:MAG: hypothetical protein R2747_15715 [Pyrinomonadaceae bacterium]